MAPTTKKVQSDSGLTKQILNNFIVKNRPNLRRAKVHVSNRIVRRAKQLRQQNAANEEAKEKLCKKADRLIEELVIIRKFHEDDLTKFALLNKKTLVEVTNDMTSLSEERALCRVANWKTVMPEILKFREQYPDYEESVPQFLKTIGLQYRKQRLQRIEAAGRKDTFLQKEHQSMNILQKLTHLDVDSGLLAKARKLMKESDKQKDSNKGGSKDEAILEGEGDQTKPKMSKEKPSKRTKEKNSLDEKASNTQKILKKRVPDDSEEEMTSDEDEENQQSPSKTKNTHEESGTEDEESEVEDEEDEIQQTSSTKKTNYMEGKMEDGESEVEDEKEIQQPPSNDESGTEDEESEVEDDEEEIPQSHSNNEWGKEGGDSSEEEEIQLSPSKKKTRYDESGTDDVESDLEDEESLEGSLNESDSEEEDLSTKTSLTKKKDKKINKRSSQVSGNEVNEDFDSEGSEVDENYVGEEITSIWDDFKAKNKKEKSKSKDSKLKPSLLDDAFSKDIVKRKGTVEVIRLDLTQKKSTKLLNEKKRKGGVPNSASESEEEDFFVREKNIKKRKRPKNDAKYDKDSLAKENFESSSENDEGCSEDGESDEGSNHGQETSTRESYLDTNFKRIWGKGMEETIRESGTRRGYGRDSGRGFDGGRGRGFEGDRWRGYEGGRGRDFEGDRWRGYEGGRGRDFGGDRWGGSDNNRGRGFHRGRGFRGGRGGDNANFLPLGNISSSGDSFANPNTESGWNDNSSFDKGNKFNSRSDEYSNRGFDNRSTGLGFRNGSSAGNADDFSSLHPSWQAKQNEKEKASDIHSFKGKVIKFDDYSNKESRRGGFNNRSMGLGSRNESSAGNAEGSIHPSWQAKQNEKGKASDIHNFKGKVIKFD